MVCLDPKARWLMINAIRNVYKAGEIVRIFIASRRTNCVHIIDI